MPNHVTHRVVVTGPEKALRRFVKAYIHPKPNSDGESHLDFERVIPVPAGIKNTEDSSAGSIGYDAWYGSPEKVLDYPWVVEAGVKTVAQLRKFLLKRDPDFKVQVDLYKRNIDLYGVPNAYEWHIENWGTKWNSYRFSWVKGPAPVASGGVFDWSPDEVRSKARQLEFLFDTAWSPPEPIFFKLAFVNPELNFKIWSFDDGWNFACQGELQAGENTYQCEDATDELYRLVYGEDPQR